LPRSRKNAPPELTPEQRRRQVVMILSTGLVAMSPAVAVPPDFSPDFAPGSGLENTRESSQNPLDLSRKPRLNVPTG